MPEADILSYAACAGAADGYHIAAAPFASGTLLVDLHRRDMDAIRSVLTDAEWSRFQDRRRAGQRAWETRMEILATVPMDGAVPEPDSGPTWSQDASFSSECGQLIIALAAASVLPE